MAVKKVHKKKTNLLKLYDRMNEMTLDAVDREVMKRLKIIIDTIEDDVPKVRVSEILKNYRTVDLSQFHEALQPYVKHCVFMLKRNKTK